MRRFEIYNAAKRNRKPCAELLYDERADTMRIVLSGDAQPADLPIMFALFAERGKRELPDKWARRWVEERVPPQGRQNLGEILRANDLDAYDEMALLAKAGGRSAQDDFLVREVAGESSGNSGKASGAAISYAVVDLGESTSSARSWCEAIGPEIADRRKAQGMTQRDLAEKTGIDQAAISRIESGRANPTLNTLDALAKGVGATLLVKLA